MARRERRTDCGECRACCITLGFEARPGEAPFHKPAGSPCRHLCGNGCAIYPRRPAVCASFRCLWHLGVGGGPGLRPDRCGLLVVANANVLAEGLALYAYELEEGAADKPQAARLLRRLERSRTVILVRADGSREVATRDPAVIARMEADPASTAPPRGRRRSR